MAYLEQSTRYIAYDHRLDHRPLPLLPRPGPARLAARGPLRRRHGPDVRHLRGAARGGPGLAGPTPPAAAGRLGLRPPPGGAGQGPRRPPWPAAGRLAVQRRHLRHRAVLRDAAAADAVPSAARGPPLRRHDAGGAAQGHPLVPPAGRPARPGRRVVGVPGRAPGSGPARLVDELFPDLVAPATASRPAPRASPSVALLDFDPDGEDKVIAAICAPLTDRPEEEVRRRVGRLGAEEKRALLRAYVGERANRRHRPGRAFERTDYRFDVVTDYGAFRDLQRHRMLTIDWQPLGTPLGYDVPEVVDGGRADRPVRRLARALAGAVRGAGPELPGRGGLRRGPGLPHPLHDADERPRGDAPARAAVRAPRAIRATAGWPRRCTARSPSGPGTGCLAEAMSHVDYGAEDLERLEAERRAEERAEFAAGSRKSCNALTWELSQIPR